MDVVNTCPQCSCPVEPREGRAVVLSRMQDIDRVNEYGERMRFLPAVTCMIAECTNLDPPCTYTAAGHMEEGAFVPNRDLLPMGQILQLLMRYREQYGQDGPVNP